MKQNFTILLLAASLSLLSSTSIAGALKPDCSAKKAGKNMAMKATVGVGGRCSATDAARDSAKGVAGIEENGKGKDKDHDKDKNKKTTKGGLKKIIK